MWTGCRCVTPPAAGSYLNCGTRSFRSCTDDELLRKQKHRHRNLKPRLDPTHGTRGTVSSREQRSSNREQILQITFCLRGFESSAVSPSPASASTSRVERHREFINSASPSIPFPWKQTVGVVTHVHRFTPRL